jgi:hypothetical protein
VSGPDGKLYRVIVPPRSEDAIHERISRGAIKVNCEKTEKDVLSTTKSNNDGSDDSPEAAPCNDTLLNGGSIHGIPDTMFWKKHASLPRAILVEDVPDEEDEELRELRSVWRNRVPSPNQWMEPVESLCW